MVCEGGGGGCFSLKNISGYICITLSFRTSVCNCVVLREGHEVIFLSEVTEGSFKTKY